MSKASPGLSLHSHSEGDVALARNAASGDESSREAVVRLAHPLIERQTSIFCKRFCAGNHHHVRCTLDTKLGLQDDTVPYCEWGNHSYAWMLDDLCGPKRLQTFAGKAGAKLSTYFYAIAHSLPFYERWKDFRFGRRVRIPEYIQKISPLAGKLFMWMLDQHSIALMAQKACVSEKEIEQVAGQILSDLTERGKLYLLDAPKTASLTGQGSEDDDPESEDRVGDIADESWSPADEQEKQVMAEAFKKLTPVEQFVLEAMVIENRDAKDVLNAFVKAGITIKKGVPPEKLDRQQLFYFKRKTLSKLKQVIKISA